MRSPRRGHHCKDGRSLHPLTDRLIEASLEAGHPANDDFNGRSQLGAGRYQLTQRDGRRCSAANAYLHPVRQRPNLKVFTETLVQRLDVQGGRLTGVSILRGGREETLFASCEVIVAAGALRLAADPHALRHRTGGRSRAPGA